MLGPFVEVFSYLKKDNGKTEKQSAGNASYKILVFFKTIKKPYFNLQFNYETK